MRKARLKFWFIKGAESQENLRKRYEFARNAEMNTAEDRRCPERITLRLFARTAARAKR